MNDQHQIAKVYTVLADQHEVASLIEQKLMEEKKVKSKPLGYVNYHPIVR